MKKNIFKISMHTTSTNREVEPLSQKKTLCMCNSNMVTPTTHPNPIHVKQKIPTSNNKPKNIMKN